MRFLMSGRANFPTCNACEGPFVRSGGSTSIFFGWQSLCCAPTLGVGMRCQLLQSSLSRVGPRNSSGPLRGFQEGGCSTSMVSATLGLYSVASSFWRSAARCASSAVILHFSIDKTPISSVCRMMRFAMSSCCFSTWARFAESSLSEICFNAICTTSSRPVAARKSGTQEALCSHSRRHLCAIVCPQRVQCHCPWSTSRSRNKDCVGIRVAPAEATKHPSDMLRRSPQRDTHGADIWGR